MIYSQIKQAQQKNQKLLAILIDPDKVIFDEIHILIQKINTTTPATHILVGGSLLQQNHLTEFVVEIKKHTTLPVVLFPGNAAQVTGTADAVLFLSLVSGRNPEYLIGQHIHAAPIIKQLQLEAIATAYVLIDSGAQTSVSYISNTTPIPRDKEDIAVATCQASELLGMQMIYLEGGSGALMSVPLTVVEKVYQQTSLPIIVGGGIKNIQKIKEMHKAGATMVVIGTAFENDTSFFV